MNDIYCDIISKITNTTYNRNINTIVMTGLNNGTAYIHSLDSLMGINVEGNQNNTFTFRLLTTMALPTIETKVLNTMAQISSPIIHLLEAIENDDYLIIEDENNLIIMSNDFKSILKINTETGIVVDYLNINANTYHGLITSDPSKTSIFKFEVGSPQAEAQNLGGQILMNVGSYVLDVPVVGWAGGFTLFAAGDFLCADANGCFSMDDTNYSRISKTTVDVLTNVPYLKVGSMVVGKLAEVG